MNLSKLATPILIIFWIFSPIVGLIASVFYLRRLILSTEKPDGSPWIFRMKAIELILIILGFPVFLIIRIIAVGKNVHQLIALLREANIAAMPPLEDCDDLSLVDIIEQSKKSWENEA